LGLLLNSKLYWLHTVTVAPRWLIASESTHKNTITLFSYAYCTRVVWIPNQKAKTQKALYLKALLDSGLLPLYSVASVTNKNTKMTGQRPNQMLLGFAMECI
jgi:hypothetical protein